MDLSWLGSAGAATVVASALSSAVVVVLDRRRHPGPDLRIQNPTPADRDGFYKINRRFQLVNIGPDPAYDVSVRAGSTPVTTASFVIGDDERNVAPILEPGGCVVLDVSILDESFLGRAVLTLRWNTRPGRERKGSHDRSAKMRSERVVDLL